jgi:hypothetical protein
MAIETQGMNTASPTMRWVRWLLLIPGAWLAWSVALVSGIAVHSALESLCPPERVISGMCTATWFRYAEKSQLTLEQRKDMLCSPGNRTTNNR